MLHVKYDCTNFLTWFPGWVIKSTYVTYWNINWGVGRVLNDATDTIWQGCPNYFGGLPTKKYDCPAVQNIAFCPVMPSTCESNFAQ